MKTIKKGKPTNNKKAKKTAMKPNERVNFVAQEFKFARLMSGNEKKKRDQILKTFKKWLLQCFKKGYEFKEDDFIRVWKGLFYAVWMSDKPLVQEDLCESIAEILDAFPPEQLKSALLMVKAGFKVLATEWFGIDFHRIDKFHMLVRRYLRGSFRCMLRCGWSLPSCEQYVKMLAGDECILALKTPRYARNAGSLILHIVDCYLEELSKVSKGEIPEESLAMLLSPFTAQVTGGESPAVCNASRRLLTELVRQSELGLQYQAATRAWQQMGCPPGGPDALELQSDDDDESPESETEDGLDESPALDPRAGRVDVVLEPLRPPATLLAEQLRAGLRTATPRAHQRAKLCLRRFEELANNRYPLKLPESEILGTEQEPEGVEPGQVAARLRSLERKLVKESDELALRGLRRRHRKRLLARSRAGAAIIDQTAQDTTRTTNGAWQVEVISVKQKKTKREKKERKNKSNKKEKENKCVNEEDNRIDNKKIRMNQKQADVKPNINSVKQSKVENKQNVNIQTDDKEKENKRSNCKGKAKDAKLVETATVETEVPMKRRREQTIKNQINSKPNSNNSTKVIENRKNYQKQLEHAKKAMETPKRVKFVLKNNSMQETVDYYKSVRESPSIPYDSSRQPNKTNLKPSTPSPINPFFKRKLRLKN